MTSTFKADVGYRASNRRLCMPPIKWSQVDGHDIYADDAVEGERGVEPFAWGLIGFPVRIVRLGISRYTLCDTRGRFLRYAECRAGEGKRRVRTFATLAAAARYLVRAKVEEC